MLSYTESLVNLRSEKKRPSKTPTNAPHLHVCIFSAKQEDKRSSWKHFAAYYEPSDVPKKSNFLIVTSLLPNHHQDRPTPLLTCCVSSSQVVCLSSYDSFQQYLQYRQCCHQGYAPTKVAFGGHFHYHANLCFHAFSTLPTQDPCCVLSGRTQMAATWCALMGSRDDFGQDMHRQTRPVTHTHRWQPTEWPGDGGADYWFAQINESQPGHLTTGALHPPSWHCGLARRTHTAAAMRGTSQQGLLGSSKTNMSCFYTAWIQTVSNTLIYCAV